MPTPIDKPSLTQRRKISGSTSFPAAEESQPASTMMKPKVTKVTEAESDEVSIGKVVMIVVGVVIVALVAALLIQFIQGQNNNSDDNTPTPTPTPTTVVTVTPTIDPSITVTPSVTTTTTPTTEPTPTTSVTNPGNENLTNQFGQAAQFLNAGATGNSIRIRTYQYLNMSGHYEFSLPVQATSGSVNIPTTQASYNADGDLELVVENISQFSSCNYLNSNNSNMEYGNVNKIECVSNGGGKYTFKIDTKAKTDFMLTTGKKDINGEDVDAVIIQIKNK